MTDKAHSLVNEGSRHAIHDLTYANASDRIAGINEGKGYNPPPSNKLWHIAKQDDDDSLWMIVDVSPLTWKQIPVGVAGTPNLDDGYDNFGANPSTVVVDAAQGQGTALKFDMNSAVADRFFEVALDNGQDPTGDPLVYHTGFTVTNGTDFWTAGRAGANQINLVGEIENVLLEVANIFQIETDSVELKLLSDVATGNFVDLFGDGKLTGSSGTQRYLDIAPAINQSGTAGYDGLRVNPAITAVGSGEQNLLNLQLGGANRFRVASDGNTRIGTGVPVNATGAGAAYVTGALEVGSDLFQTGENVLLGDNSGGFGSLRWRSAFQTVDTSLLMTGNTSNAWVLCEYADRNYDFAHALQTNPTLFIHSASQSTTEWLSLAHDQTRGRIVTGAGAVCIGTGTPDLVSSAGDLFISAKLEVGFGIYQKITGQPIGMASNIGNYGSFVLAGTSQTNASGQMLVGTSSNSWIMCQYGDKDFDFTHSAQSNPTLFIHSASQSTTEWLSLAHDQTHARLLTGAGAFCVGTGTPSVATAVGALYVTGKGEFGESVQVAPGRSFLVNGQEGTFGHTDIASYGGIRFRVASQTPDTNLIMVGAVSKTYILCDSGDAGFDFAHTAAVDPTLIGHSSNQSTTEYWSLTHDRTDGVLATGAGALSLAPASGAVNLEVSHASATKQLIYNASDNASADSQTEWRSGTSVESALLVGQRNTAYTTAVYRDRGFMITDTDSLGILIAARKSTGTIDFYAGESTPATKRISVTSSGMSMGDASQTLYDITPASDHTATGDTVSATVDTNATGFAAALYQASDGNWDEADADAIATMPCRALALETGTGTKLILRRGWIRDDSWSWTPGAPVYASTTAGGLTQTKPSGTGDQVQIVGYAETATVLDFNPSTVIVEVA